MQILLNADTTKEVATPGMVSRHPLIKQFSNRFPEFEDGATAMLVIGRNCPRAMATECLTSVEPYVHKGHGF